MARLLIISADDYGYAAGYDRGILDCARAGAIDAASAMVTREGFDPEPLLGSGVEVGLHLDLTVKDGVPADPWGETTDQLERFRRLVGVNPVFIDGHHHCHAIGEAATAVAELAAELELPVRSISPAHRELLRERDVATPDLLIGRLEPGEPVRPPELDSLRDGITEWMVHPGRADGSSGSGFDAAREEDLALLLAMRLPEGVTRVGHEALTF
jgi:predicted glycoside hydrolase/deacetylase ChbG (UPF0249 family)